MGTKKVIILCGLIGSGKTTYARKNYKYFTDLDFMPKYSRKKDQINWTTRLLKKYNEVCHITTYPTDEEITAFKNLDVHYHLIDTSIEQCKKNILIRNRNRDMENIMNVFKANIEINNKISNSKKDFKRIKVFGAE